MRELKSLPAGMTELNELSLESQNSYLACDKSDLGNNKSGKNGS